MAAKEGHLVIIIELCTKYDFVAVAIVMQSPIAIDLLIKIESCVSNCPFINSASFFFISRNEGLLVGSISQHFANNF